jgi:hypothetical protein
MIGSMFRKAWYSDSATLSLDFTTGVLDSRLTFTRSSTATYIDSSGYVASASIDSPRFDHDPTTLAPRGLLIEGQTANAVTYSDCRTTGWSGLNATGTNDSATAPDNTTTATLWTGGSGGGNRAYSQTFSVTSGNTYTASVYVKKPTSNAARYAKIYIRNSVEGVIGWPSNGVLDLDTGVISGTGYTVTPYSNGWYRIVSVGTVTSTTNARVFIAITDSSGTETPTPTVTTALLWWGAQLETGSGASSYIPTGASTATRAQDLVSITSTNFSSWWTSNNPASFLVDISSTNRPLANHIFRIADSSGSAYGYQSYFNSTTMPMQVRAVMSSTASSDVAIGSNLAANTRTKIGFTVETASLKRFRDGSLANTLNTPTLPPNTLTQMYIGGTSTFGNSSADFHIRQFKYWPITLSDAVMQGLTT